MTTCNRRRRAPAPRPTNWASWRTSGIGASSLDSGVRAAEGFSAGVIAAPAGVMAAPGSDGRRRDHARQAEGRQAPVLASRRQAVPAAGGVGVRRQRTTRASPWPPPPHRAATPTPPPRRRNSCSRVRARRLPEAPIGWPRAMAPPLGLTDVEGQAEFVDRSQRHRRERLVELEDVHVATPSPARSRALAVERDGWVIRQVSGPATMP